LGYTMELLPLIIKVSALNQLMRASRKMRRVVIKPGALYAKVAALLVVVAIVLIAWTVVDPPSPSETRTLDEDRTTVFTQVGCLSSAGYWTTIYYLWELLLVLVAFVLAFQSRKAKAEFNESKSLGLMIYSHFVFSILRVVVFYAFDDDIHRKDLATSFLLSVDVILGVSIYLLPKFKQCRKFEQRNQYSDMHGSTTVQEIQQRAAQRSMSGWQKYARQSMRVLFGATNNKPSTDDTIDAARPQENEESSQIMRRSGSFDGGKSIEEEEESEAVDEDEAFTPLPVIRKRSDASNSPRMTSFKGNRGSEPSDERVSGSNPRDSHASSSIASRPSLKNSVSKLGRESMRLLFGPSADLEIIVSKRSLDADADSDLYELSVSSEGKSDAIAPSDDKSTGKADDKSISKSNSDDEVVLSA
jgi:hypothetical protein